MLIDHHANQALCPSAILLNSVTDRQTLRLNTYIIVKDDKKVEGIRQTEGIWTNTFTIMTKSKIYSINSSFAY